MKKKRTRLQNNTTSMPGDVMQILYYAKSSYDLDEVPTKREEAMHT